MRVSIPQRDGSFSGGVRFTCGGSREPPCTFSFGFMAEMRPDGTITAFRIDRALGLGGCTPASDASVSGTATHSEIRIAITDRATCPDWRSARSGLFFGAPQDTDRIVTISVRRLSGVVSAMSRD
jgi:hypothetical protein